MISRAFLLALVWSTLVTLVCFALLYVPIVSVLALIFIGVFILGPIDSLDIIDLGASNNGFFVPNSTGILFYAIAIAFVTFVVVFVLAIAANRHGSASAHLPSKNSKR